MCVWNRHPLARCIHAIAGALPIGSHTGRANRSTLPFPIRDVNPKAAVRRRSWIPLAVLMSLVYVALLSPSLKQRCPLNLDLWVLGLGHRHREAAGFASA